MKLNNLLTLTWKKFGIIIIAWVVSVILHNAFYAIFGIEEAIFFLIATVILPVYLTASLIYTFIKFLIKKKTNWKILGFSFILIILTAFIGSQFTSTNTGTEWYESIKPSITPPNYVFPIAWNILFFLIALSLYFTYVNSKTKKQRTKTLYLFGANFILNILWSSIFFALQKPAWAFLELIFLWISILLLTIHTYKIDKKASIMLWPYLAWVTFAGILNYLSAF
jgi:translocator protein